MMLGLAQRAAPAVTPITTRINTLGPAVIISDVKKNSFNSVRVDQAPANADTIGFRLFFPAWLLWGNVTADELPDFYVRQLEVSFETDDGVRHRVTFGGANLLVPTPGQDYYSDPLPIVLRRGSIYKVRCSVKADYICPVATIVTGANGKINSVSRINNGSKLRLNSGMPALTATVAGGTGATLTPVVTAGVITAINVGGAGGTGYTNGASVVFSGGVSLMGLTNHTPAIGDALEVGQDLASKVMVGDVVDQGIGAGFGPTAVLASSTVKRSAIVVIGDSLPEARTGTPDAYGRAGYIDQSIGNERPILHLSRGGDSFTGYLASATTHQRDLALAFGGVVVSALGRNDLNIANQTLDAVKAKARAFWAPFIAAGIPVKQTTCPPTTLCPSGIWTEANQTIRSPTLEIVRLAYNEWLRTEWAAEGLAGLIDIAFVFESQTIPGVWKDYHTGDGIHALQLAVTAARSVVRAALL